MVVVHMCAPVTGPVCTPCSPSHPHTLQLDKVSSFEEWANPAFIVCFVLAGIMGVILQYSTYLCTQVGPCPPPPHTHTAHAHMVRHPVRRMWMHHAVAGAPCLTHTQCAVPPYGVALGLVYLLDSR